MSDFNRRCTKAIQELNALAQKYLLDGDKLEYQRLTGKMEGVRLAESYAEDAIKRLELELARKALEKASDTDE